MAIKDEILEEILKEYKNPGKPDRQRWHSQKANKLELH